MRGSNAHALFDLERPPKWSSVTEVATVNSTAANTPANGQLIGNDFSLTTKLLKLKSFECAARVYNERRQLVQVLVGVLPKSDGRGGLG